MPNRFLKESICVSDDINGLSWFEEVLFYRLIVNCDDFGRYDGRIPIIKNKLFPLKENLTLKTVENGINTLARLNLVTLYEVEGKPYLFLPSWNHHQTTRATNSKYPAPEDGSCKQMKTDENICKQVQTDAPVFDIRYSYNDIRYSINDNSAEQSPLADLPPLPLNDGSDYSITVDALNEWKKLYPAVDVEQELRNMRGWLISNPTRKKTKAGINRFITGWLSKEQDSGKRKTEQQTAQKKMDVYAPQGKPSYDLERAEHKMKTTVPKLTKRGER